MENEIVFYCWTHGVREESIHANGDFECLDIDYDYDRDSWEGYVILDRR